MFRPEYRLKLALTLLGDPSLLINTKLLETQEMENYPNKKPKLLKVGKEKNLLIPMFLKIWEMT